MTVGSSDGFGKRFLTIATVRRYSCLERRAVGEPVAVTPSDFSKVDLLPYGARENFG